MMTHSKRRETIKDFGENPRFSDGPTAHLVKVMRNGKPILDEQGKTVLERVPGLTRIGLTAWEIDMTRATLRNWTRKGWVTPYQSAGGRWLYDIEQTRQQIQLHKDRARKRKERNAKARPARAYKRRKLRAKVHRELAAYKEFRSAVTDTARAEKLEGNTHAQKATIDWLMDRLNTIDLLVTEMEWNETGE